MQQLSLPRIAGEILIDRPVAEVFDAVSDERNEPRYNPDMLRSGLKRLLEEHGADAFTIE